MAKPLDMVVKSFNGYNGVNPLVRLALALGGEKFGSNVKIDDKELDILNKILAKEKFYDDHSENRKDIRWYNRRRNPDLIKLFGHEIENNDNVFGEFPYQSGYDVKFTPLQENSKRFGSEKPYSSGMNFITPSVFWEDVFRNNPRVIEKCFDGNINEADCDRAIYKLANDNVVSDAFLPYMEEFANLRAGQRKQNFVRDISANNYKVGRINTKRPQAFANDFANEAGTDARTAKNDALHRINKQWRDYYKDVLLKNAEEDGVFLDPLSFTEHPLYHDIANKLVSGEDVYEVPEIPEYDGYKNKGWFNLPNWSDIVRHVTKARRKEGYAPVYGSYSPFMHGKKGGE